MLVSERTLNYAIKHFPLSVSSVEGCHFPAYNLILRSISLDLNVHCLGCRRWRSADEFDVEWHSFWRTPPLFSLPLSRRLAGFAASFVPGGEAVNCWCGRHFPAVYKEAPGLAASVDRFVVTVAVAQACVRRKRERPSLGVSTERPMRICHTVLVASVGVNPLFALSV